MAVIGFSKLSSGYNYTCIIQASVVQKVDCAIHRINHYPADKH